MKRAILVIVGAAALAVAPVLPLRADRTPPSREVVVNVIDKNGGQPTGLAAENFRGEVGGRSVEILSARLESRPRCVALIVDTSASMDASANWKAAKDLVSVLAPYNAVAILMLSDRLTEVSGLSRDLEVLGHGLRKARDAGTGPTALYGGLLRVSKAIGGRWDVGDVIALITDGADTASSVNEEDSTTALVGTGLRVCVLWLEPRRFRSNPPPWEAKARHWVGSVTEATGGFAVSADKDGLEALRSLASSIMQVYRLEILFPQSIDQPQKWELKAVGQDGKELKGVRLVYPHRLGALPKRQESANAPVR